MTRQRALPAVMFAVTNTACTSAVGRHRQQHSSGRNGGATRKPTAESVYTIEHR
jgi:hypothetical protein